MFALVSKLPDWGNYKMDFISMVKEAVEAGCSDIHMSAGNCPAYRLHGQMRYWEGDPLTDEDVTYMISQVLNKERFDIFMETCDVDGADNSLLLGEEIS